MTTFPFTTVLNTVLTSGGTGTMQYTVPPGEKLTLEELVYSSTGAFSVTDIRDSSGRHYTNAAPSNPLTSVMLKSGANNNNSVNPFKDGILIDGGLIFYIDVVDTSAAANTVRLGIAGKKDSR